MKTKENRNSKKGISLIVLVITIIVIIILALAVILSINKNNPIENARKARFLNDIRTIQEDVNLYVGKQYVESKGKYNPTEDSNIQSILEKYTDYKDKVQIIAGKVILLEDKISETEKEWAQENGVSIETLPVIPVGFKYLYGTVDEGYVIINKRDGNEFVWVPVEVSEGKTFEEVFIREDGYANGTLETYVSLGVATEPLNYNGVTASQSEINEYNAMRASIEKYGGFYIGRYEASDSGNGIAQSKKVQIPWTINWGESMADLTGGAVEKARAVYPDSTSKIEGEAVSTLIYGVQWDATVRWLEKTYPGISKDSTNFRKL